MQLHQLWRTGLVRRFHTVASAPEQNNAAHQWGVAMLLLALHPAPSFNLLAEALVHDVGEKDGGDVPATAKWANETLAALHDDIEDAYRKEMTCIYELTDDEMWWLKCADMLELSFYVAHRLNLGDRYFICIQYRCRDWFEQYRHSIPDPIKKEFWESCNVPKWEDLV